MLWVASPVSSLLYKMFLFSHKWKKMRKLRSRYDEIFLTERRNRNRFMIEDDLAKWSSEELLDAVNAVMKALQSSDELLDVNWLSFDLRQKFGCYFDDSLVWVAVKYLSNEGYHHQA